MRDAAFNRGVTTRLLAILTLALGLSACAGGGSAEAQGDAQAALERWSEMRPREYTFVVVPEGVHSNIEARIRVRDDVVIENLDRSGKPAGYDGFTMTAALQEALDLASREELFAGAYDPKFGYLVWYDVPSSDRNHAGPSRGIDVTCFETSVAADACRPIFTEPTAGP